MERVHRWLDRLGERTGYHVLPVWRLNHWHFAAHVRELFTSLGIDLVLDVGANKGQYRDFLRRHVHYLGPIVSFEPISHNVERLRKRALKDPQWEVRGWALGPATGTRPFNVMHRDTLSSFLPPDNRESSTKLAAHNSVERVEQVQVKALADVWEEVTAPYGADVRVFLKMDTQGFDLQVMEGARPVLDRLPAAQTELLLRPLYEGTPHYTDALRAFESLGFDVAGLFPVSRDLAMRVRACDCTLINRSTSEHRTAAAAS